MSKYKTGQFYQDRLRYKILIICGPSQTGKTTLMNNLIKHYPDKYKYACACTTRPKRDYEVAGKDYYFIEVSDYELIKKDMIFKTEFAGNFYGTLIDELNPYRINIAVVNSEGIDDVKKLQSEKYHNLDIVIVGLRKEDIPYEREGRTEEQIKMEFDVLNKSDITVNIKPQTYVNEHMVNDLSDVLFKYVINEELSN